MGAFFKTYRARILFFSAALALGVAGVLLFWGKSNVSVLRNSADESSEQALPSEDSDGIVKKIESGNTTPGEAESADDPTLDTADDSSDSKTPDSPSDPKPVAPKQENEVASSSGGESKSGGTFSIENRLVSWGFSVSSGRKVDTIVIHSTYNATGGDPFSVSKILDIYKSYGVSPHYLVARDGTVYRLVDEKNTAYHAGDSKMPDGRTNVNAFSIGIEVIGKDDGSPSEAQYGALKKLIADIETRHSIKHILGHSDIAPGRKSDPWGFDWKKIGGKKL